MDVVSLLALERYDWPWSVPKLARRLKAAVREFRPQIIQIHAPVAVVVAARARILAPAQQVVHGYGTIARVATPKAWIMKMIDRWAVRTLQVKTVVVAPLMARPAACYYNQLESAVACVPNGIDIHRFPFIRRILSGSPIILMVGTLASVKRHRLGIAAMVSLGAQLPQICLQIAGDGPLREHLKNQIVSLGLEGFVELLGQRSDIPGLMARADVLWHLSESEGLPLVVAEAMASGLPVIGCNVAGVRDLVIDGQTGFLISADQGELVARTKRLLTHRDEYQTLALAARRRVEAEFSSVRMIEMHEQLLREQIASAQGRN